MFELKKIADKHILFVMAADAEYGPELKERIKPLMCGVGPVEAAISVTKTLAELKASGNLPDTIVSLGSAGSRVLKQAEVYQASHVSYRDMDASPLGFEKGATPFLDLPIKLALPICLPDIPSATLSTGANIVSGAAYDAIDAEMVDMETFAILRVCHSFDLQLLALRGISDGDEELKQISDWTEYLEIIDQKLAHIVDQFEGHFAKG